MRQTTIISIIAAVSVSISGISAQKPKTNRLRGSPADDNQVVDIVFGRDDLLTFPLVDSSSSGGCARDQCMNPTGECARLVQCFVDPCQFTRCGENSKCTSNFCGGCHAICSQVSEESNTEEDSDSASLEIDEKP
eukprot:scaffold74603_cov63-Cyclotella_meneghiniana.AAC.2